MVNSRSTLIEALKNYKTVYKEELPFRARFMDLLQHKHCYERDNLPGHLTGSAFIIDESREYALLLHHAKLNKWLQPGGHADGDENIVGVALREAEEETGLQKFVLLMPGLFDIDIHTIPERKDFPEHLHFDVRFLFQASKKEDLIISEESLDMAWVPLEKIDALSHHNAALLRMVSKARSL